MARAPIVRLRLRRASHFCWGGSDNTRLASVGAACYDNAEAGVMYVENRKAYDIKCATMTASHAMDGGGQK